MKACHYQDIASCCVSCLSACMAPTYLLNLYVSFSAMSRSPMSNVGYMDSDGMNRGSAMNLHG